MTSSNTIEQIADYQQKALQSIPDNHPHKAEIIKLLNEQIKDDFHSQNATYPSTN